MFKLWKCCREDTTTDDSFHYPLLISENIIEPLSPFKFIKQTSFIIIQLMLTDAFKEFRHLTPHELNKICLNIIAEFLDKNYTSAKFQQSLIRTLKTPNIDKLLTLMQLKPVLPPDLSFKELTLERLNNEYLINYTYSHYSHLTQNNLYFLTALRKEHRSLLNYITKCYSSLNLDTPLLTQEMNRESLNEIITHFNELTRVCEISSHSYSKFMATYNRISKGLIDLNNIKHSEPERTSTYTLR